MLKLQYFGHLMQRTDWLEKTLMLGKIEDRRRRGWQTMKWCDSIPTLWPEFDQTPGVGDRRGSLACCSPWGRKELDTTELLERLLCSLFRLLPVFQLSLCHTFWQHLTGPFFFPLSTFQLESFLLTYLQFHWFLSSTVKSTDEAIKSFLISVTVDFSFNISFWLFLSVSLPLLMLPICFCILSTFF